ncbi:MAG: MOSC domain-containing protein [Deltaproteobacteria bacterium]|nr:MAG: MOSC domain-containing protein [Deltaproteobacteria bacterium]
MATRDGACHFTLTAAPPGLPAAIGWHRPPSVPSAACGREAERPFPRTPPLWHSFAMAEIVALYLKPARRAPMQPVPELRLVAGRGIEGNANQGGKRQVTVLAEEAWRAATRGAGASNLDPALRRANVLIRGLDLAETVGRLLELGPCRLLVRGETTPCHRMEEVHPGLEAALRPEWRGGVFGEVLEGGLIRVGDPVVWAG